MEETMHDNVALTRTLLLAVPIAVFAAVGIGVGLYASLMVLVVGITVLVARRRSLPDALVGPRGGRWWVWTLVGLATVGSSIILSMLAGQGLFGPGELGWLLFSLLFFVGALIVGASIVRALALLMGRPPTPSAR
jgi:hypothetical protein